MTSDLRPLGAGEILDRAVTLFVRNFWLLVLILALVAIPVGILSYIAQPDIARMMTDLQSILTVPPGHTKETTAILERMTRASHLSTTTVIATLLSWIVGPLATTACIIAIARGYRNEATTLAQAYREATRRWVAQIITLLAFVAIGVGVFVALMIAIFALSLVFGIIIGVGHAAPRIAFGFVGIPLALILFFVTLLTTLLVVLAWHLATISIAIEEPDPARAVGRTLRRTFSKDMFWRSALMALIVFTVQLVGSLVLLGVAGLLAALTHVPVIALIIASAGGIVINVLVVCYLVVYSFDVRIRREGFDLTVATQVQP